MAGNYPDVPGHRMALDKDGSVLAGINASNVITQLTNTQVQYLNDEDDATYYQFASNGRLVIIFPEARDVYGIYVNHDAQVAADVYSVEASPNSTTGLDGSWTSVLSGTTVAIPSVPKYREAIQTISAPNTRALRISFQYAAGNITVYTAHVYGDRASGANPNRLELWHPTLDQKIGPAYFDWGNTPRSSSADKPFRVKNLSSTLTANSIGLSFDALTNTTPSVPGQHVLSTDGSTFTGTVNIGNLAPGAVSGVLTARRITPSNASLGLWALRLNAEATSWS